MIVIANVWLGNVLSPCLLTALFVSHDSIPLSSIVRRPRFFFSTTMPPNPMGADCVAPSMTTQLTASLSYRFADCVANRVLEIFWGVNIMPHLLRADCVAHQAQLNTSLYPIFADSVAKSRVGKRRCRPFRPGISNTDIPPSSNSQFQCLS